MNPLTYLHVSRRNESELAQRVLKIDIMQSKSRIAVERLTSRDQIEVK